MTKQTAIITHHNADLDALASLIAAQQLYEGSIALLGRSISPPVQRYLALHKDHFTLVPYHLVDPETIDRVVVVDVRDRRRLAEYEPILSQEGIEIIVYDHHPAGPHDLETPSAYVEPVGSCATLLTERLKQSNRGMTLTPAKATLLLLGVYSDTGKLCFDTTTPRDVDAVAYLLRRGANLQVVNRYLAEEFSVEQQQLLVGMMANIEEVSVDAVEVAISIGQAHRFVRGSASVVQHIMNMGGHDAIFGVVEFVKNKRVQIIGRSRVPYVHMGDLLTPFGGGGHGGAAAATVKKGVVDEVVAQLHDALEHASLRPTRVRDMMSAPVQTIMHQDTMADLQVLLDQFNIHGVPVMRDDRMCGVISRRDLDKAIDRDLLHSPVSAFMSSEVTVISPDEPLEDAMEMMTERDIGRLPVLEQERLVGIISRTDMIRRLYH